LGDNEPVVVPFESYAEFHEDEDKELSSQVGSLITSSDENKIHKGEQEISHA
jgi:hypothetical protein